LFSKIEIYEAHLRDYLLESKINQSELPSTFYFALLGGTIVNTKFLLLFIVHYPPGDKQQGNWELFQFSSATFCCGNRFSSLKTYHFFTREKWEDWCGQ
jgi:hypothetical protein